MLTVVGTWTTAQGISLGQLQVEGNSNEWERSGHRLPGGQPEGRAKRSQITAVPALLDLLDLLDIAGCTVTTDAMGRQKEIAATCVAKEAGYLLALKGNQGNLAAPPAPQPRGFTQRWSTPLRGWSSKCLMKRFLNPRRATSNLFGELHCIPLPGAPGRAATQPPGRQRTSKAHPSQPAAGGGLKRCPRWSFLPSAGPLDPAPIEPFAKLESSHFHLRSVVSR